MTLTLTVKDAFTYISGIPVGQIPHCIVNSLQFVQMTGSWGKGSSKTKITNSLLDKKLLRFPSGTYPKVVRALKRQGIEFILNDETSYPTENPMPTAIHLRPYQEAAIDAILGGKNEFGIKGRGILDIATGGGKTLVATYIAAQYSRPTIFFVHTRDLLMQTKETFEDVFGPEQVGIAGGGGEETFADSDGNFKKFIVAMVQSFAIHGKKNGFALRPEYEQLLTSREVMFCDECHHQASDTWFWVAQACPAALRIGLSATPWHADRDDILLEAATGPVVYEVSSKELVELGWLSKPDIRLYLVETKIDSRFYDKDLCDQKKMWPRIYKVGVVLNPHRNAIIVARTRRALQENKSVLIIINHTIHGAILSELLSRFVPPEAPADHPERPVFMNSKYSAEERGAALRLFRSGKIRLLIGTSVAPDEPIWIRNRETGEIFISKIGDFASNFNYPIEYAVEDSKHELNNEEIKKFDALTETKDHSHCWRMIKAIIRHENKKNNVQQIKFDNGMLCLPTSDHSFVDRDFNSFTPSIDGEAETMNRFCLSGEQDSKIDVVQTLLRSDLPPDEMNTIEVIFSGINRDTIYKLQHIRSGSYHSTSHYKKGCKVLSPEIPDPQNPVEFTEEFYSIVWYEKGKYRCKLTDFAQAKHIKIIPHKIVVRRSRSKFSLPDFISMDNSGIAFLLGAFAAEGSLIKSTSSQHSVFWSCHKNCKEDKRIGFSEKTKIREMISDNVLSCFGIKPISGTIGVELKCKLAYALFSGLKTTLPSDKKGAKQVPSIIWDSSIQVQKEFLWGYFCGDGSLEKQGNSTRIIFTSVSYELICGIKKILENLGSTQIYLSEKKRYEEHHQRCYSLRVSDDPLGYCSEKQTKKVKYSGGIIRSMEVVDKQPEYVYDISVEETETFFSASGALLHNTLYDEGVDLPTMNVCIMGAAGKSDRRTIQRLGRSLRRGNRCIYITVNKNCSILGSESCPLRCVELQYDNSKYDEETVNNNTEHSMNEYLGNIKVYTPSEWEVVSNRTADDANSREILQCYNACESNGFLSGKSGIPQVDNLSQEISEIYSEVSYALQQGNTGKEAKVLNGTWTIVNGKNSIKPPTEEQIKWHSEMTQKSAKLFMLCNRVLGIVDTVSVMCPHKKVKDSVEYVDFIDKCDKTLLSHSLDRLRTYDDEGHYPLPGSLDDFYDFSLVEKTKNFYIDYDQMMAQYGELLLQDSEEDSTIDQE